MAYRWSDCATLWLKWIHHVKRKTVFWIWLKKQLQLLINRYPKSPAQLKNVFCLLCAWCLAVQSGGCAKLDTRRLFSHPSAEGGQRRRCYLKSQFDMWAHEQDIMTSQVVWSQSWPSMRLTQVWCGNLKPLVQIQWEWTSQWSRRYLVSSNAVY